MDALTLAMIKAGRTHWAENGIVEMTKTIYGGSGTMPVNNFPAFGVGDTVKVKLDNQEYTAVAVENEYGGAYAEYINEVDGAIEWYMIYNNSQASIYSRFTRTLTWEAQIEIVHTLNPKYVPYTFCDYNGYFGESEQTGGFLFNNIPVMIVSVPDDKILTDIPTRGIYSANAQYYIGTAVTRKNTFSFLEVVTITFGLKEVMQYYILFVNKSNSAQGEADFKAYMGIG